MRQRTTAFILKVGILEFDAVGLLESFSFRNFSKPWNFIS